MKKKILIGVGIVVMAYVLVTIGYNIKINTTPQKSSQSPTASVQETTYHLYTPEELLAKANELRNKAGLAPLKLDTRLNTSAQLKANDMVQHGYFAHDNPTTGKHGYSYIMDVMGPICSYWGENLSYGPLGNDPFDKDKGWPSSKPHLDNILNAHYTLTGFSYAQDGETYYYVEHFCTLK